MGAAGEQLDIPVRTCVTPATSHYHLGVIAQAFATLQEMNDQQVVLGLSTGEAMNETPLGFDWPGYGEQRNRLEESLEIIRQLWERDDFVDYDGDQFQLDDARLYTKPEQGPEIHIAANGPSTASLT